MPDIAALLQAGVSTPWLYLPAAVLLGALHALEPGHSKSLMAAFIIAIRGTVGQAVLLGLAAAIGHSVIVWGLAGLGFWLGDALILEKAEPWLVLLSGLMIIALALRLLWSMTRPHGGHGHDHHDHDHHDHGHDHDHAHDHDHDPAHAHADDEEDAHAAAHAREIEQRFAGRSDVTTGEILWFGFTGGLLPCPSAIAVLLVCLQLKQVTLGFAMVAAFSLGLAITLVAIGVIAAWGAQRASRSWSGFSTWSKRLPYFSGGLVLLLGIAVTLRAIVMLAWH